MAIISQISQQYILLPFNIQDAFIGCLFFALGDCGKDLIQKYIDYVKEKKLIWIFFIIVGEIIVYYITINYLPHQWMNLGGNIYTIVSIVSSIIGMFLCLTISIAIEKTGIIDEFLQDYGRDSMFILMLHTVDILMIRDWSKASGQFLAVTILGYAFINYLRNRIIKILKTRKEEKLAKNVE